MGELLNVGFSAAFCAGGDMSHTPLPDETQALDLFSLCSRINGLFGNFEMASGRQSAHANMCFGFDGEGPQFGSHGLLEKSSLGFKPRSVEYLAKVLDQTCEQTPELGRLVVALGRIANAMNRGEIGLAAIATSQLRFTGAGIIRSESLLKAGVNDPKHPGYPAGTADGKGGQFRPNEAAGSAEPAERSERLRRLATRKTFRSIASRVLSWKRLLRMIGRYVEGGITEEIPVVNDAVGIASMKDDLDLMLDMASDVADSDAAIAFVNKGPAELSELQPSPNLPQSFRSFEEFKKADLEKQFGPAGEGYDYHHIVEQGPNAGVFTQEQLQSTENIVRIPRLLHEELNSVYGSLQMFEGIETTPRLFLRGRSFEYQRQFGLKQLRRIGVIN